MIPWFFTRDEIQKFANLSLKKKSKRLTGLSKLFRRLTLC